MPNLDSLFDVIIIGGGAAGLMAATSAGERGKRVLLLEKNKKIGVKILMSGGTRCNITHDCGIPGIISAFGRQGKFLHSALAALPPAEVIRKIEAHGVATKTESTGKIFPVSDKAIDVRDALLAMATTAGAKIITQCSAQTIRYNDDTFSVATHQGTLHAKSLIITTGGRSYPGCGTTGDGYDWASQFGHAIVATHPALTPILSNCHWAHKLKGITIEQVHVRVQQTTSPPPDFDSGDPSNSKKTKQIILSQRTGSFLFTHWGFSGPAVLDVSREVARHPNRKILELVCDFLPSKTLPQLLQHLADRRTAEGKQSVSNLLNELFPKRLNEAFLLASGIEPSTKNAELSKKSLTSLAEQIKNSRFPISGTLGFEKAEVTSGGVDLKEIDSRTMQSKRQPGLYFAGEILDLDGHIGGFNFQSAFSTGWLAGQLN